MSFTPILQLFISLTFIFLLLSIMASGINEIIVYVLQARGYFLKNALKELLDDALLNKNYAELLYDHPLVDRLKKTQDSLPSYITSDTFAACVIDVIGREYEKTQVRYVQDPQTLLIHVDDVPKEPDLLNRFTAGVNGMRYSDLKIFFRSMIDRSKDVSELKNNLEKWYNDYMDRVSGWYKNRMQWYLFLIGAVIAIAVNVDSIKLTRDLYHNQVLSSQLSSAAEGYVQNHKNLTTPDSLTQLVKSIDQAYGTLKLYDLPIGWEKPGAYRPYLHQISAGHTWTGTLASLLWEILLKGIGWLITAVALSFGAPFWFDLLGKLVDLRKAGKKPVDNTSSITPS